MTFQLTYTVRFKKHFKRGCRVLFDAAASFALSAAGQRPRLLRKVFAPQRFFEKNVNLKNFSVDKFKIRCYVISRTILALKLNEC